MTLPPDLRALIEAGPLAHLTTINPDGSPQVTVVWIGLDGDDVISAHMQRRQKVKNLQRDPRYALSFDAPRTPGELLAKHAVLRGTAKVIEGAPAGAILHRLTPVYVGPDVEFPAPADAPGYVIRYHVDKIGGVGPWVAGS